MVRILYVFALSLWFGGMAFFSLGVAPSVFARLPTQQAGDAMSAIFPTYYAFGACAAAIVLISGWFVWRQRTGWRALHSFLAGGALAATLLAGVYLQPRATELRTRIHGPEADAAAKEEFASLHRWAVNLNGGVLLIALVVVCGAGRLFEPSEAS